MLKIPEKLKNIALAFSGGGDSVALFYRLLDEKIRFTALHFNHKIIGEKNEEEENFVTEICKKNNVTLINGSGSGEKNANESMEMAARRERFCFFAKCVRENGFDAILTAHHCDDVTEQLFLRLWRGSGIAGLTSLKPLSVIKFDGVEITLFRPFIDTETHEQLLTELQAKNRIWFEDISNKNQDVRRNKIRSLLSTVKSELPGFTSGVNRSIEILREEDAAWEEILSSVDCSKRTLKLPTASKEFTLSAANKAAKRRLIGRFLQSNNVESDFATIESLRQGKSDNTFIVQNSEISFRPPAYEKPAYVATPIEISSAGVYFFGNWKISVTDVSTVKIPSDKWSCVIPACRLLVRCREFGDRISPVGLSGSKKVKDIFIDAKADRFLRDTLPLFFHGEELIWIPGFSISEKIRESAYMYFLVKVEKN